MKLIVIVFMYNYIFFLGAPTWREARDLHWEYKLAKQKQTNLFCHSIIKSCIKSSNVSIHLVKPSAQRVPGWSEHVKENNCKKHNLVKIPTYSPKHL